MADIPTESMLGRYSKVAAGVLFSVVLTSGTWSVAETPRSTADLAEAVESLLEGDSESLPWVEELARGGNLEAMQGLAVVHLRGALGEADTQEAMGWFCLAAHDRSGGPQVMRAVWYLAEFFRTGGGVPGTRYNDGDRHKMDPLKAYFWFTVMADQASLYDRVHKSSVTVGKVGRSSVGRDLYESEREAVAASVGKWRARPRPKEPAECLKSGAWE